MIPKGTLNAFILGMNKYINENPSFRKGQAIFNYTATLRSDLTTKTISTEKDCFYSDERITNFLTYIYENWENENV